MKGKVFSVAPIILLLYIWILVLSLLAISSATGTPPAARMPDLSLSSLVLLALSILLGIAMYAAAIVLYYTFFCEDVFLLHRKQDSLTLILLRLVNPIREQLSKPPIWEVPGDVPEKELVELGVDWFSHIDQWLNKHRPFYGRAARNKALLRQLARRLVADMVQALWDLEWSRRLREKLLELELPDTANRVLRLQQTEQRELERLNRSFESLVSLATRLVELGSQVDERDVERLLEEFREIATQIDEDTLAWDEVKRNAIR
jgi:hypothetical protein